MLVEIAFSEPCGLTTNELKEKMKCTRETIRRLGNELIKERKIIKTGRFGHYHIITNFALSNADLQGSLFRSPALKEMLETSYYKIPTDDDLKEIPEEHREDFKKYFGIIDVNFSKENQLFNSILNYFFDEQSQNKNLYEKAIEKRKQDLLNFYMKIGLLINFIMIEAIKPTDRKIDIENQKINPSYDWIKASINLLDVWKEFKEIVRKTVKTKERTIEDIEEYRKRKDINRHEFFDADYSKGKLFEAFEDLWPFTFNLLQTVKKESMEKIQRDFDKTPQEFDEHHKILKNSAKQIKEKIEDKKKDQQ